jgi:hypothetical protein
MPPLTFANGYLLCINYRIFLVLCYKNGLQCYTAKNVWCRRYIAVKLDSVHSALDVTHMKV